MKQTLLGASVVIPFILLMIFAAKVLFVIIGAVILLSLCYAVGDIIRELMA